MRKLRTELLLNKHEKKELVEVAEKFGMSQSDYVRRKLFEENEDLAADAEKFISPHTEKNQVIQMTVLYKIYHMIKEVLSRQDKVSTAEIVEADIQALEYARREREKYGYKHIKHNDE